MKDGQEDNDNIELIYKEAQDKVNKEYNRLDKLDSKVVTLQSINALVITVIIGIIININQVSILTSVTIGLCVMFLFLAFIISIFSFFVDSFINAPNPEKLYNSYKDKSPNETKKIIIENLIRVWNEANNLIEFRFKLIRISLVAFLIGMYFFFLYVIQNIFTDWIYISIIFVILIIVIYLTIKIKAKEVLSRNE